MIRKCYSIACFFFLTIVCLTAHSQTDEAGVKATVNQLFEGMKKGDTSLMRSTFTKDGMLQSAVENRQGKIVVINEPIDTFLVAVGKPHDVVYDERIQYDIVKIDGPLAVVWAPYTFYLGDKFSHCGVDSFQLVKIDGKWKIQYIIDTRRKDNCK